MDNLSGCPQLEWVSTEKLMVGVHDTVGDTVGVHQAITFSLALPDS